MNRFIKSISHLIISTSNATLEVPSPRPCIDLLNSFWDVNIDDDLENLLKARFIWESDKDYPQGALLIYAENEPFMKKNGVALNDLPGQIYTVEDKELWKTLKSLGLNSKKAVKLKICLKEDDVIQFEPEKCKYLYL